MRPAAVRRRRGRYVRPVVVAAFVAPFLLEATTRFVATAAQVPGVRLAVITSTPADRLPPELTTHLDGHWRVDDALDPRQIAEAVAGLSRQMGRVERLIGALEQLQVPLAQVREAMGIEGMDVQTARNVLGQGPDEDGPARGRRAVCWGGTAGPTARRSSARSGRGRRARGWPTS